VRSRGRFALRAAVSATLILILVWKLREQGGAGITLVNGWWLVAAVCLVPVAVLMRAVSFHLLINRDGRVLAFGGTMRLTLIGAGAGLFLPGGTGDLLKAAHGARTYGSPERIVATTVVDKLTSLVTLGALGVIGAVIADETALGVLSAAALIAASAPLIAPSIVPWRLAMRVLAGPDTDPAVLRRAVRTPARTLVSVLAVSTVGWALTFSVILACCRAAGAPVATAEVYALAPLVSLSSLVPISLAGLGLTQVTMALLLSRTGATPSEAISASFFQLAVNLTPGLLGLALYAVSGRAARGD